MWSWAAQYQQSVSFLRLGARWLPLNSRRLNSPLNSSLLNSYMLTRHSTNNISRPPDKNSLSAILSVLSMVGIYLNSSAALANDYPTKAIKMIVPFAPGGGNDAIGRMIAKNLSEYLGQQVIVDNRAGAGGKLGVEAGVRAEPDGYTITLISNSYAANASLFKIPFDPIKDVTPIGMISKTPLLVAVRKDLPVNHMGELIQYAKAHPGKLSYASSGTGGISHLSTELFLNKAGIEMTHVPYKGTAPALTDIVGGITDVFFSTTGSATQYLKAKKIKVLAVTTPTRSKTELQIPTIAESGIPSLADYGVTVWYGLVGPKNLSAELIQKLNSGLKVALENPQTITLFKTTGDEAAPSSAEEFKTIMSDEIQLWRKVVTQAKIKVESTN